MLTLDVIISRRRVLHMKMWSKRRAFLFISVATAFSTDFAQPENHEVLRRLSFEHETIEHNAAQFKAVSENAETKETKEKLRLIVFIHGSLSPIPSASAFVSAMKEKDVPLNNIVVSMDKITVDFGLRYSYKYRKKHDFAYGPSLDFGLVNVATCQAEEADSLLAATCCAQLTEMAFSYLPDYETTENHYYTFGWEGYVKGTNRKFWAEVLYDELTHLITQLHEQTDQEIEVELWCHSHGGNVALLLGAIEEEKQQNLRVRLRLFGTPIQTETEKYVFSPVFTSIINLYSRGDFVQKIDFFSTKDFFSRRRFGKNKKKPIDLPPTLKQVEVTVGKYRPGHGEFWVLGYGRSDAYRRSFPLYPLPLFVFTPFIVHQMETELAQEQELKAQLKVIDDEITIACEVKTKKKEKKKDAKEEVLEEPKASFGNLSQLTHVADAWYKSKEARCLVADVEV